MTTDIFANYMKRLARFPGALKQKYNVSCNRSVVHKVEAMVPLKGDIEKCKGHILRLSTDKTKEA